MNENFVPFQVHVLLESLDADDDILRRYVNAVVPNMLAHFSTVSAKGGKAFLEKCRREGFTGYHDKPDQSMVAHILNGIFPVMRIVKELERRNLQRFSEIEKQLYLTAYTFHDLDKIVGEKDLYDLKTPESKAHFRQQLTQWSERLAIAEFFPQYAEMLEDIIFIIMNTQEKHGVDLLPYNFDTLKLDPRRIDTLCELSRLSDVLNYVDSKDDSGVVLTSPANLCLGKPDKPRKILTKLSNGQLCFAYHQLSTVTGLLTNFISNAIMQLMKEQGHLPLLFFPNGVVYLSAQVDQTSLSLDQIFEAVRKKIVTTCKQRLRTGLTGIRRGREGIKIPDYYHEFFSVADIFDLLRQSVVQFVKNSMADKRLDSIMEMQTEGGKWGIPSHIDLRFDPSVEVDILAEYLTILEKTLKDMLGIEESDHILMKALALSHLLEDSRAIPDKGGQKYRWFFVAGKYLQTHRGLDQSELDAILEQIGQAVREAYQSQIEQYEQRREAFGVLRAYLESIVDLQGNSGKMSHDFSKELKMYVDAKKSGRKTLMCSLCSTAYETDRQKETAVIFQPQVYSNKQPLNKAIDRRGICDVCALELMLRQIMMKSRFQASGSDFENLKVKYLYIYPGYYFTPETAKYVASFYRDSLKRLNLFTITKELGDPSQVSLKTLLELRDFQIERDEEEEEKIDRFLKMELPKDDLATLFFFGVPAFEKNPTETESWITPAFLALSLPFVLSAKVVVSEFPLPLYVTGNDFKETVIFDAPHHFLLHLLGSERFRVDEALHKLLALIGVYRMHLDVFSSGVKPNWSRINEIAENIDTDRMFVFHYLMKLQRDQKWESFPLSVVARYLKLYLLLQRENDMSLFKEIIDKSYIFYRPADFNSHNIHRPLSLALDAIIRSDKQLAVDDVILQIIGDIKAAQDRVHNRQAKGYAPIGGYDELAAIRTFVEYVYHEVFLAYCRGERAVLRDRANRIKSGCEAYYLETYAPRKKKEETVETANAQ